MKKLRTNVFVQGHAGSVQRYLLPGTLLNGNLLKFLLLMLISAGLFSACRKTPATAPATITAEPADQYVGNWQVHDDQSATVSGNHAYDYVISIEKTSAADKIILKDFAGESGLLLDATISGSNFTIPQQTMNVSGATFVFSGGGSVSGKNIDYTYTITRSSQWGGDTHCTCTGTKQ